ncbi:MAG: hypothetical protein E6H08_10025 [Bacteroidetes bacterium]|nr:MAG: hypothetical protein E6H08_10025 [Bacteroidota bacterium]
MKAVNLFALLSLILNCSVYSQQEPACKVTWTDLIGTYSGACKNGFANGKGEAKGVHYYKGSFKDGKPDGDGLYYYNDSVYYDGPFQDGLKEGKGEMHYLRRNMDDSIVKGYWSGDLFKGNKFAPYSFSTTESFDNIEITSSKVSGKTVTIEITTTSGTAGASGSTLALLNLISTSASTLKIQSRVNGSFKNSASYEVSEFPCRLFGTLSDGNTFGLDLNKAANWKIRLYKNQ